MKNHRRFPAVAAAVPAGPASRRRVLRAASAAAASAFVAPALHAQAWPERPIRMVVPFPPGALTDVVGRMAADVLRDALGQPVVVENRPGAGTLLAGSQVAKAAPDGYTLMVATSTTLGIAPALYKNPPMRIEELTGVAMVGDVTLLLVTRPDFPARDLRGLVAEVHARPGKYNFASPSNGTVHHLLMELLKAQEKLYAVHIAYQGSAQALADIMTGRVDFMFIDAAIAMPQVTAGKINVLAVSGSKRFSALPNVPAITEVYPALDITAWQSIAAPAGLAAPIAERVNAAVNKALDTAAFRAQLDRVGIAARPMTVADFNTLIRRDAARWADAVRRSGAKVD